MSQNDVLHLQANFKDWSAKRGSGLNDVDPFLYYVLDQILKPFNLSDEEIRYGITDGGNDGGVDAIYLLAKRNTLIRDDVDLKASGTFKIRIIMVQVKSSLSDTGFKPTDIDKFQSFTEDFLDLSTAAATYRHKYHTHLITIIQTFKDKYLEIAGNFPEVELDYYLVTRVMKTPLIRRLAIPSYAFKRPCAAICQRPIARFTRSTRRRCSNTCGGASRLLGQLNGQPSRWQQMMDMSGWSRSQNT